MLAQLSVRVVNVHGNLRLLDFGPHPEPVFVAFEKLLPDRFFLPHPEVAAPIIFAHLKAFLDVRLGRLEREGLRVIDRGAGGRDLQDEQHAKEKGGATGSGNRMDALRGLSRVASHNRVIEARRDLVNLFHRGRPKSGSSDIDQRFHFLQRTFDLWQRPAY